MVKDRLLILFFLVLLADFPLVADSKYLIEIKPSKKIIHLENLGVSENTAILDVLNTMPELLTRASSDGSILANYSIQVDGKDVGQSRDVVLSQMMVAEVNVIEISTSPTVSEQKNGTGGVINIKLKPLTENGVQGAVLLDASTEWDVQPSVLIGYKMDKFLLRSSVRAEYYRPTSHGYEYLVDTDSVLESNSTSKSSFKQETAKLYMEYTPTKKDELKIHLLESYGREQNKESFTHTSLFSDPPGQSVYFHKYEFEEERKSRMENLTVLSSVEYVHKYTQHEGELDIEAQYSYIPSQTENRDSLFNFKHLLRGDSWDSRFNVLQTHEVTGAASSKHLLYKTDYDAVDLKYGINVSFDFGKERSISEEMLFARLMPSDTATNEDTKLYASPYVELNYKHEKWYLQAGARYQYYRVNLYDNRTQLSYVDDHTYTANISVGCNIAKDHHLRLIGARNIRRWFGVDEIVIYPYYNADLNYIFEWQDGVNTVTTSASANYIYAKQEQGYAGIASVNLQLVYQRGIFSMAFAGNGFARSLYGVENPGNRCWYYNLSLLPVLSFRKHWTLSGKIVYNSKVKMETADYGDCVFTQIRVSKQIKKWNLHMDIDDIFDYTSYNTFYKEGASYKSLSDPYTRCFRIGFLYMF